MSHDARGAELLTCHSQPVTSQTPKMKLLLPLFVLVSYSLANTEKVIFSAPPTETLSELYDLKEEIFQSLTPRDPVLRASLLVAFPTTDRPKGTDSWYRVEGLEEDKRYEVRVCWAATVCMFCIVMGFRT